MANWSDLKAAVASIVKTNGNKEITGQLLQDVLNNIISNVGLNSSFAGIATPGTNPGTPDGNVFYLATTAGTYSNFNGIVINSGEAVILEWKGSWLKKDSGFATKEKLSELEENTNQKLSELESELGVVGMVNQTVPLQEVRTNLPTRGSLINITVKNYSYVRGTFYYGAFYDDAISEGSYDRFPIAISAGEVKVVQLQIRDTQDVKFLRFDVNDFYGGDISWSWSYGQAEVIKEVSKRVTKIIDNSCLYNKLFQTAQLQEVRSLLPISNTDITIIAHNESNHSKTLYYGAFYDDAVNDGTYDRTSIVVPSGGSVSSILHIRDNEDIKFLRFDDNDYTNDNDVWWEYYQGGGEFLSKHENNLNDAYRKINNILANTINLSSLNDKRNQTNGDWTPAIQYALDNYRTLYIDVDNVLLDGTITMHSSNQIIVNHYSFIRRNNPTSPIMITCDENSNNIEIRGGVWFGNNYRPIDNIIDWTAVYHGRVGFFDFYKASNVKISDMIIQNVGYFVFELTHINNLIIDNIKFSGCKQDGIHLNGNVYDFAISNISGWTSDDLIALNGWDWYASTPEIGSIRRGSIRNVYSENKGIRLLCGKEGSVDCQISDIYISNVKGMSNANALLISHQSDIDPTHVAEPSKIYNIFVDNFGSESYSSANIQIENCEASNIVLNNIQSSRNKTAVNVYESTLDKIVINGIQINDNNNSDDYYGIVNALNSTIGELHLSNIYAKLSDFKNYWLFRLLNSSATIINADNVCVDGIGDVFRLENSSMNMNLCNSHFNNCTNIIRCSSMTHSVVRASGIFKDADTKYLEGVCDLKVAHYEDV